MMCLSKWISATLAIALLAGTVAAGDTAKALDIVPQDALGFILIKDLRQLSDKVDDLAKKLKVEEYRSLLQLIRTEMDIKEGLNDKGCALILAMKGKKELTFGNPIIALPMSDHGKMLAQLGVKDSKERISKGEIGAQSGLLFSIGGKGPDGKVMKFPILVAVKGDFVLLAAVEDRDALVQILDSKQSVLASVQQAKEWLDEQDICGVCTQNGVEFGIAMGLNGPDGGIGSSTPGQFDRMKDTFAEMKKNVKLVAFGTRIEKEGHARLLTRVYFEPKGSYAAWMSKATPLVGEMLSRMPDQPYIVAALARVSAQVGFDGIRKMLPAKMPAESADKLTKEYRQILQRVSEVGILINPDKEEAKTGFAIGQVQVALIAKVDDATAFVEETMQVLLQTHQALQKFDGLKTEVKTEQKRIADKPSWLITTRTPQAQDKKGDPSSKEATSFSEETILFTEIDAKTVLLAVVPKGTQAESVVKMFSQKPEQALSANRGIQGTAALLPKQLQVVVYISMATVMKVKQDTPPLAFALRTLPAGVEAQFVVPFDALQAMFEAIRSEKKEKKDK